MRTKIPDRYLKVSLWLSLAISLTIHFSLIAEFFLRGRPGHHEEELTFTFVAFEFITTAVLAFLLFLLNYWYFSPYDIHKKIKLRKIILAVLVTGMLTLFLIFIFVQLKDLFQFRMNPRRHVDELISRNLFCAAVVLVSVFVYRLLQHQQLIQLEMEKLRSESLQSQFESLKNQVSPHFLFNSLTALKVLTDESPQLAKQYITHLSQVLRYTLQSKRKQLVSLDEELEFTQSYLFLLKMRYDTNLVVTIRVAPEFRQWFLPPLTIQTLLENAVKHNEISNRFPLEITIATLENSYIRVSNQIREKLTKEEGTGTGLVNLSELFRLLGEKEVEIYKATNEFVVEVPLFRPVENESADH